MAIKEEENQRRRNTQGKREAKTDGRSQTEGGRFEDVGQLLIKLCWLSPLISELAWRNIVRICSHHVVLMEQCSSSIILLFVLFDYIKLKKQRFSRKCCNFWRACICFSTLPAYFVYFMTVENQVFRQFFHFPRVQFLWIQVRGRFKKCNTLTAKIN